MKTKSAITLLCLLIILIGSESRACNVCGGSSGGSYMGVLPQIYKNFAGIRYLQKSFVYSGSQASTLGSGLIEAEQFNTFELWGRFYPVKNLQVLYFIPYSINERQEESRNLSIRGIGDISITANYNILNRFGDSTKIKQMLLIGGGIKLPTGLYQQRDVNKTMFPLSFQVATGSYAFQPNLIYTIRYKKLGLNTDINYRINLQNELSYKLGNQLNASTTLFYWQKLSGRITLLPQAGMFVEKYKKDREFDLTLESTGGMNLFFNAGIDIYFRKVVLGGMYLMPVYSDLPATMPDSKGRSVVSLTYLF